MPGVFYIFTNVSGLYNPCTIYVSIKSWPFYGHTGFLFRGWIAAQCQPSAVVSPRAAQRAPTNASMAVAKTGLQAVLLGELFTLGSANSVSLSAHFLSAPVPRWAVATMTPLLDFFLQGEGLCTGTCTLHESSILRSYFCLVCNGTRMAIEK